MPEVKQITSSEAHPTRRMKPGLWAFARVKGFPGRLFHKYKGVLYDFWAGKPLFTDGSQPMEGPFRLLHPVWEDLQVPISSVRLPAAGAPIWTAYKGGYVLAFSPSQDNKIYFTAQIPHAYKEGQDIDFHIHTAHPDSNAGNSIWNLTYSWANIGDDFPVETAVNGVVVASPTDADKHELHEIADMTGTSKKISSLAICCLEREGTIGGDTYASNVYLVALDFHIPRDTLGSKREGIK